MTRVEKTILINQFRILSFLDDQNQESYQENIDILESRIPNLYDKCLCHDEEFSKSIYSETHAILTMYRVINNSIKKLDKNEIENIDLDKIAFEGFDGSNDDHYFVAIFLIEKQDLYTEHKNSYLNSHSRDSLSKYRKMLNRFKQLNETEGKTQFNLKDLQSIIDAI